MGETVLRRWGDDRALIDDGEARRRLVDAAARCIGHRGDTAITMADIADRAGVARSTLYRYFPNRDSLLLALLVRRIDDELAGRVSALRYPRDPRRSIVDLMQGPISSVSGDPLNEALMTCAGTEESTVLTVGSDEIVDAFLRHIGPLLAGWQECGLLHADLDVRETVRWMHTAALFLLRPPWRTRSMADKRRFVEQYLVRSLVPHIALGESADAALRVRVNP